MASGQIRITPEQLRTEAGNLTKLADQHDGIFQQMTRLVENLSSQWEGQALDAFVGSYNQAKTELAKFKQSIDVFTDRMKIAAQKLEETDANLSNSFK